MAQASTTPSLPEAAYALAAHYDLGAPLARYQHRVSKDAWVFAGIAPVIGGFLLLNPFDITRAGFWEPLTVLLCVAFLSVSLSALGEVIRHLFYRRSAILVCTAGLLRVSGSTQEVVRWEEVESVVQVPPGNWGKYGFGGPLLDIEPACIVRSPSGRKLTCKVGRSQTKHLGEMVARATAPYLLPRVLAAYQDGGAVVFGPLLLTQQGISRGNTFLPWSQYRGYLVTGSLLMILQWGGERWGKLPVRKVPNLPVLTSLLDQIQRSQRESVLSGPFQQM
jgi:hypothetical protein